jgi:deoxyribonuclease-4
VYKINEIVSAMDVKAKIGIETTGKINEVGSLEEVIDIVKRTQSTEPVINWAHVHARGVGALRSGADFNKILSELRAKMGSGFLQNMYCIFSGASYGPSGMIKQIPISRSDMKIEHLVDEVMGFGAKGTMIIDDPGKDKFCLDLLKGLADMVR